MLETESTSSTSMEDDIHQKPNQAMRAPALSVSHILELLSSMRFAISLLVVIAIASMIGTVLKQNEPMPNYVNQFGPFWFEVFSHLSLYTVYSAWWFLLSLGFLVVSTSLCIWRNAPKMLKNMRAWQDQVREQSLRNFHHHCETHSVHSSARLLPVFQDALKKSGYQTKVVAKENGQQLITAKRGAANKWGYIFAHSAIVIICLGGLLDSDLPIRFQTWLGNKVPFEGSGVLISSIPEKHRMSLNNPTFRGNTAVPEGQASNTVILQQPNGVFIQDLPFTLTLKKFNIEFYSTGMPKLFASEVTVTDHETGKSFDDVIKVNHPLIYKGVAIYQSSFDDGGSKLVLNAYPMHGNTHEAKPIDAIVGKDSFLNASLDKKWLGEDAGKHNLKLEVNEFRIFNVENMSSGDARTVNPKGSVSDDWLKHLGAATQTDAEKNLKNVGPSIKYKLRDAAGQAKEFHHFMNPMLVDGDWVFMTGLRESNTEGFRYLRIPADDNDSVKEWMRLRAAFKNPQWRLMAAQEYARLALPVHTEYDVREQLASSANRALTLFAGEDDAFKNDDPKLPLRNLGGYIAVSAFVKKLPALEQEKAAEVFIKILNGSAWHLFNIARAEEKRPELEMNEKNARFMQLSLAALSDAQFYGSPVYLHLQKFEEVKASVFQMTKSPGKNIVYVGCILLVLGIFAMFYVRERRIWIWLKPTYAANENDESENGEAVATNVLMAMSTQRKNLDFEKEYAQVQEKVMQIAHAS